MSVFIDILRGFMNKKLIFSLLFPAIFALAGFSVVKADEPPPGWLLDAARIKVPEYDVKNVPAVILRKEESVSVAADGTITSTVRYAVRILVREGRGEAMARAIYEKDGGKVREISAWLIRSSGQIKSYGKKETI